MKSHYKNEAEFYADFNAMMREREKSPLALPTWKRQSPALQHSKAIPIQRTTGALAHTPPMPITRTKP